MTDVDPWKGRYLALLRRITEISETLRPRAQARELAAVVKAHNYPSPGVEQFLDNYKPDG